MLSRAPAPHSSPLPLHLRHFPPQPVQLEETEANASCGRSSASSRSLCPTPPQPPPATQDPPVGAVLHHGLATVAGRPRRATRRRGRPPPGAFRHGQCSVSSGPRRPRPSPPLPALLLVAVERGRPSPSSPCPAGLPIAGGGRVPCVLAYVQDDHATVF